MDPAARRLEAWQGSRIIDVMGDHLADSATPPQAWSADDHDADAGPRGHRDEDWRKAPWACVNEDEQVVVTFQALADEILAVRSPRLIAVDGRSGSGKTAFAARLRRFLAGAVVIEVDDFLNWSDLNDWWLRLENEALAPLLAGDPARFRTRDWNTDPLGKGLDGWREVDPAHTIIVEGVTSSRASIADKLSMSFWVEAPPDVRMARGIARDGEAMRPFWQDWMRLEDEFFALDDAPGRATYLIAGEPAVFHDAEREVVVLVRSG